MKTRNLAAAALLLILAGACSSRDYTVRDQAPDDDSIDILDVVVALPEADGKELVETSCVPCHSLRYIEMQPPMPRKAWEKTVAKMISAYGAPVRDSATSAKIVDYLARIKGTE